MAEPFQLPRSWYGRLVFTVFMLAAIVGFMSVGLWLRDLLGIGERGEYSHEPARGVPWSVLAGPPRVDGLTFELDAADPDVVQLSGLDDPQNERWADVAGNSYTKPFVLNFSYAAPAPEDGPQVLLRYDREAPVFRGRLEARNLKPNFAYQIKLLGDYRYPEAFDRIGAVGRWRLPGWQTNYTDAEARAYPDKSQVESYLFFDFFVTDAQGNAIREFEQDHSLHVLWNRTRGQPEAADDSHYVVHRVDTSERPAVYVRSGKDSSLELIFAERENRRYSRDEPIRLAPGDYPCYLILTEESWHANGADGGWWATVYKEPIRFTITAD